MVNKQQINIHSLIGFAIVVHSERPYTQPLPSPPSWHISEEAESRLANDESHIQIFNFAQTIT